MTLLHEYATSSWDRAIHDVGEAVLRDIERRLTLLSIDECWSEHIERVADMQESIHLSLIGGLDPLIEFQKEASSSYDETLSSIDERIIGRFKALDLSSGRTDIEGMGLRGPSSTWTYLVSDLAYTDRLAATMISSRHIGFAANAALLSPMILIASLVSQLKRRRKLK